MASLPYGDFDDSDDLEGNDDDIGALESILSWDDEDEDGVSSNIVETSNVLEERNTLTAQPLTPAPSGVYSQHPSPYLISTTNGHEQNTGTAPTAGHHPQQFSQVVIQHPQNYTVGQSPRAMPPGVVNVAIAPAPAPIESAPRQAQPSSLGQIQPQQIQNQMSQQISATAPVSASVGPPTATPGHQPQQMIAQKPVEGQPRQILQRAPTATVVPQPQQQQIAAPGQQMIQTVIGPNGQPTNYYYQQPVVAQNPNPVLRQVQLQYQTVPARPVPPVTMVVSQQAQPQKRHQSAITPSPPVRAAPPTTVAPLAAVARKPAPKKKDAVKPPAAPKSNVVSCASDTDGETKQSAKKKIDDMANMTPAEKAKANRDRNREHARNTRLRKKAYLEKLKTTVDELCRERDTLVSERAGAANLLVEMHNTRTEVLMSFFALRSGYEEQRDMWSSILDESCFSCVLPVTPYRSFPASEVQVSKCQRTIMGIDGMMGDTASLHVLLNSLIDRSRYPTATIQFRYTLVTEDAVVAGNQMMARWVMTTLNATQFGARLEVSKQGMLCCKFNSAHKIVGLELMFDVMAFMLQLKQAAGSDQFAVIPNTVQTCQRPFNVPMVMTVAERPYTIVQVNQLWEDMTGFKAEEVVGRNSCRVLQGQSTDRVAVEQLMSEVRFKRPASVMFINYTKQGRRFRNYINVYPLSTDSKITHYVGLTSHYDDSEQAETAPPAAAQQAAQQTPAAQTTGVQLVQQPQLVQPILPQPAKGAAMPPQIMLSGPPGMPAAVVAQIPGGPVQQVPYFQPRVTTTASTTLFPAPMASTYPAPPKQGGLNKAAKKAKTS